jgi:hypothetical protein
VGSFCKVLIKVYQPAFQWGEASPPPTLSVCQFQFVNSLASQFPAVLKVLSGLTLTSFPSPAGGVSSRATVSVLLLHNYPVALVLVAVVRVT